MARISARSAPWGAALLSLVFALTGLNGIGVARSATICTPEQVRQGSCDTQLDSGISGGSVTLIGSETTPGQPAGSSTGTGGGPAIQILSPAQWCLIANQVDPSVCDAAPVDAGIPPVTIDDVATFIPTPGRQQMEPDGWTVAGLDTNFYAITGSHIVNGTLLGRAADVRFTPASYLWAYGDGASATRSTPGATWASQGIGEFEPTPTSHVYEQLGDYTITLDIVFAAEYRFAGGPWRAVVGTITLPANDLHIRVGTAKTVLVEHDCLANPSGPGC